MNNNVPYRGYPLHYAICKGRSDCALELLRAGANPMLPNANGKLAYELAVSHGCESVAHEILRLGLRRSDSVE